MFLMLYSGYKDVFLLQALVFVIHECGHLFFIYLFKIHISKIKIYPFGGTIETNKILNYPLIKDFLLSFGGILFNLVSLFINKYTFCNNLFTEYSLMLVFINLVPIVPLDGSRMLFILLSSFLSYYFSYILTIFISISSLIFYLIYSFFYGGVNYIFMIVFLVNIYRELFEFNLVYNKFLFERFIYNFEFKRVKKHESFNLKLLRRETTGYFGGNSLVHERILLSKKFDNSSYFW
jgi:stage IV sporulation protein FB